MRIYFAAENQEGTKRSEINSLIINYLNQSGVMVMSNLSNDNLADFSPQDLERINQSGEVLLEKMDAVIIEGTKSPAEAGYLIALALTHKKPILYLCQKNRPVDRTLARLENSKTATQLFNLSYYTTTNLEKILADFLQTIERGEGKELPTIKFTLRLTPRIDRYLSWKIHNTKLTKADFLREQIEKLMKQDQDYSRFNK